MELILVIETWYTPNIGGTDRHAEPPLKKGSKMTIGHGVEGQDPWKFTLRPNSEKELGFLKLYVSTAPSELDAIQQTSPFASIRDDSASRGVERSKTTSKDKWVTKVIKLIQQRGPNSNSASGL